jgi:glyoxylase-like metal-dependent hydrolase (beta-lactamase superfamily II)
MGDAAPEQVDPRFTPVGPVPRSPDDIRTRLLDEGFWQLTLPLPYPATKRVNAYLLDTDEGRCLIDCGSRLEPCWDFLERALALANAAPDEIALLVTTHHHPDHAGQAERVLRETGAEYAHLDAPQTLNELLRDYLVPLEERRRACREQGVPEELVDVWATATLAGDGQLPNPEPDRRLREGDILRSRAGDWTVVPATGHSASQLVLFDPKRRWLLSADLILRARSPFLEWARSRTRTRSTSRRWSGPGRSTRCCSCPATAGQ